MNYSYCLFLFVISILMISCGQEAIKEDIIHKQIKDQTSITIPNYTLINAESSSAIGDYSESFILKFDSSEFQLLVNEILNAENYSDEIISKTSGNVHNNPTKCWRKYDSGYKFEVQISGKESIAYYVNTNRQILYYIYIEE